MPDSAKDPSGEGVPVPPSVKEVQQFLGLAS